MVSCLYVGIPIGVWWDLLPVHRYQLYREVGWRLYLRGAVFGGIGHIVGYRLLWMTGILPLQALAVGVILGAIPFATVGNACLIDEIFFDKPIEWADAQYGLAIGMLGSQWVGLACFGACLIIEIVNFLIVEWY